MAPVKLPGAHRVTWPLAGGGLAIYWYRRRGQGPAMIAFRGATPGEALRAEAEAVQDIIAAYQAAPAPPPAQVLRDLVTRYKAAPDGWLRTAESTRATWAPWLDAIVAEWGDLPLKALAARGMRAEILAWRDRFAATPRAADTGVQVLNRVLNWGVGRELADKNPAAGIEALWTSNRADVIVTPAELDAICAAATPAGARAFRLAAQSGMRRGDLITLTWAEVSDFYIDRPANKSLSGRRLLVPLTAAARTLLADLRARNKASKTPSTYVLTHSRGGPWQKDGLGVTWNRAVKKALGEDADKHFHDLRGTAVTGFCQVPLTDEEIADIMAWEPERVRAIRKRYVDRNRIVEGIIARIEKAEGK
ncbi:tyrosine-type recombinase/integrase [Phenylobacterium sp.]|uniref:tyrosine-type recombinase/integrase n=1 Tax=Phenylobacterium sp. TaxID=1871053 RepID=UPI00301BCFDF